ncbi:MAG: hypothetical protein ACLQNE_42615 [Thermoguttaceae bacterium]
MELAKFIKTHGLRLPTLFAPNEVKDEPASVVNGEGVAAFTALGFDLMPHFRYPFVYWDSTSKILVSAELSAFGRAGGRGVEKGNPTTALKIPVVAGKYTARGKECAVRNPTCRRPYRGSPAKAGTTNSCDFYPLAEYRRSLMRTSIQLRPQEVEDVIPFCPFYWKRGVSLTARAFDTTARPLRHWRSGDA